MKYIYRVSALATFLISIALVTTGFGQDRGRKSDLSGSFRNYELANIAATTAESINGSRKTLRFTMKGELIEFDLAENDLRAPGYKAVDRGIAGDREIGSGPVNTFKGTVRGSDGSEVRISIRDSKVEGFFRYDGEQYFIEPAAKYSNDAPVGSSVIYKAEDSLGVEEFSCLADVPTRIKLGDSIVSNSGERSLESLRRFDVATEADLEWVNIFGSAAAANNEILAILNMVEGTYIAELSLRIRVTYQHTWTTPDPYASSSGSSGILLNFRNHWNANYQSALFPRNVAHLFTAKSNSLSQGVAYIGVVCQNGLASYGLTGYVSWVPGKYLVPAHELGHNLGAQHAEAAQSCGNTLMNAQLSGSTSLSFCSFSQSQINGYIATSGSCLLPATSKIYDFDGDNRADMAVFRPTEGNWYIRRSNGGYTFLQFGLSGDKPVSADYDGDGRMDAAVYRNGIWWRLKSATNTVDYVEFGLAGDIPVPAHFDTDGKADVAVYRPSSGEWYWIQTGNGSYNLRSFGLNGDIPLPADYDGDGRAELNVFRPANGNWYRLNSSNGAFIITQFGLTEDKPIVGDFDGDGRSDLVVWRPSTAVWHVLRSADLSYRQYSFGLNGDIPAAGDFDGDGRADISVYRPSNGTWYRLNSSNGNYIITQYGLPGDTPVPAYYIQ